MAFAVAFHSEVETATDLSVTKRLIACDCFPCFSRSHPNQLVSTRYEECFFEEGNRKKKQRGSSHKFLNSGVYCVCLVFVRLAGWEGPSVLYFGDSLWADLVEARKLYGWTTGAIIYDVEIELEKMVSPVRLSH